MVKEIKMIVSVFTVISVLFSMTVIGSAWSNEDYEVLPA